MIIPAIGLPLTIAGSAFVFVTDVEIWRNPSITLKQAKRYEQVGGAMFTTDVVLNWIVTTLISWKLYRVGQQAARITGNGGSNRYTKIILALVESGAILSIWMGLYAGLMLSRNVSDESALR